MRTTWRIGAIAAALLAIGCASAERDLTRADAGSIDAELRRAGFQLVPGDTPARIEAIRGLPPLAFTRVVRDGKASFVFADPDSCQCLWVGTPDKYRLYQQEAADARAELIDEEMAFDFDLWPDWPY